MRKNEKLLTEVELEMMNIIWRKGEGTVSEVLQALPRTRELAYTSVSTILRILEKKKVLTSRRVGRGHVYVPLLVKETYEAKTVDHLVERVFEGTPSRLVRCLLETKDLSDSDLREIKKLIQKRTP